MRAKISIDILVVYFTLCGLNAASAADYPLKPVPFNEVEMTSDFWLPRLVTQRETLVPWAFHRTQPGVEHLQAARDFIAGEKVEGHRPHRFIDSDLYKVMEGAAYLLQLRRDPQLEARLDKIANLIAAAQHENLYSAMADVGTLTGDPGYGKALDRIWADITNTRMHITGGLGAVHGIEGFGPQYELPNADAFNETCAAVGTIFLES